ncbi:MAG: holo-ACP synthase [Planctomycetota bacterium]
MIIGMGIDLAPVADIQRLVERHQARFLNRVFTRGEQEYSMARRNRYQHLAARFAAKEATAKALGTGIGRRVGWTDIEVIHNRNKAPSILLHAEADQLAEQMGVVLVHVSLTHTDDTAAAVVVLEK